MDEPVRAWTLEEANAALGWVRELVENAQDLWTSYRESVADEAKVVRQNGHGVVPADPQPIKDCVEKLSGEGIILRDIDRGLIDFPAQTSDGRPYYLCWLPGEDEIGWWHWLDAGFAGRTPIDDPPDG